MSRLTRRSFAATVAFLVGFKVAPGVAQEIGGFKIASPTPAVEPDTSVPGVVTLRVPIDLGDNVVCDYLRILIGSNSIVGVMRNEGNEVVMPTWELEVVVRDMDGVILESAIASADYPVLTPGATIGFEATFYDADLATIDQSDIRMTGDPSFLSGDSVLKDLQTYTVEVESETVLSLVGDMQIEYVVRNTSDTDYSALIPHLPVWDANGLYCGSAYANVFTEVPAGDAIRFETHSAGSSINPLDYAGQDFTWDILIIPLP